MIPDEIDIVLVCGGRKFANRLMLEEQLDALHAKHKFKLVVHGNALGADTLADVWAQSRGVHVARVPALWEKNKFSAGSIRNRTMLLLGPKLVVAFPGGNGTADMVKLAKKHEIKVLEIAE